MMTLGRDMRLAFKSLCRQPGFVAMTIATLALGIGASTAIFSVMDAVLLRPLPFPDDRQLVLLTERNRVRNLTATSFPALEEWRHLPELRDIAAYTPREFSFGTGADAEHLSGVGVSPGFFRTLGVAPELGPGLPADGPRLDPNARIVLDHELFVSHFAGDPAALGRTVMVGGLPFTLAGVMPRSFTFPPGARFWTTLPTSMQMIADDPGLRFLDVVGRLQPNASVDHLRDRLRAWAQTSPTRSADAHAADWQPEAVTLRDATIGGVRTPIVTVFLAVALLLLVACANLGALSLARGRRRLVTFALQSALGASRGHLVRQLAIEALLLSFAGVGLAILCAALAQRSIVALSVGQIPRIAEAGVDLRVIAFACAAGVLTTCLVGAVPAWTLTRTSHLELLQRRSRGAGVARDGGWFAGLVGVEFAIALLLVAGAGLLINSYVRLTRTDTGITPDHLAVGRINIPLGGGWSSNDARRQFHATWSIARRISPACRRPRSWRDCRSIP